MVEFEVLQDDEIIHHITISVPHYIRVDHLLTIKAWLESIDNASWDVEIDDEDEETDDNKVTVTLFWTDGDEGDAQYKMEARFTYHK